MRKRLKIVSLLTALALLGGLLGGCGKSSRIETDSVAVQETTDPLLAEHQKQLEQLNSSYTKRLTSNSQGWNFICTMMTRRVCWALWKQQMVRIPL